MTPKWNLGSLRCGSTLSRQPYLAMVLAAIAVRLAMILITRAYIIPLVVVSPPYSFSDTHFAFGYEIGSIAHSIVTGHGFGSPFGPITGPTAWIGPVYPYLCAAVFKIFCLFTPASAFVLLFLNSIFAGLTCIPLYRICELTLGRAAGLWTGWVWALVPYFWVWPASFIWETCLVTMLLAYLISMTLQLAEPEDAPAGSSWVKFGLLWGVAVLTSPVLFTFFPVSFGWLVYRRGWKKERVLRSAAASLVVCALVITPWLVRNRIVFGQFVFIRSNFWFEFHIGNYHRSNGFGWGSKHPSENANEREEYARMGEIAYVAAKRSEAIKFVRQYPREFLALTLKRTLAFWSGDLGIYGREPLLPGLYGLLSVLTALGLVFAVRDKLRGAGLFLGLLVLFPLPNYIAFTQLRYRRPIEPEMLALTVYSFVALWREYRRQRGQPHAPVLPINVKEADATRI